MLDHVFAGLPALWLCGVFLMPLGFTLVFSFGHSSFGGIAPGFTLDNYARALSGFYLDSFVRTIRFALSGCALCLLVAYPAALYISRQTGTRRTVLLLLVLVPYFTSFLIRVMSWQILLARGGPIEWGLSLLHLLSGRLDVLDTQTAVFIGLVYVYLYRTRLGTLTRAVMSRRDEAFATGINVDRVCAAAFGIGLGLAAIAGVFAPFMFGSVTPAFGGDATVTAFVIVVLGSLGNPLGTALGGIVYGICYMLVQTFLSSWADLLPYVLLILVLLLRPSGLLGRKVRVA